MAFCNISGTRASSSRLQTPADVPGGKQSPASQECRTGSFPIHEIHFASSRPEVAIQLIGSVGIGLEPSHVNESLEKPYPRSNLFAGFDSLPTVADLLVPLGGKPLKCRA